MVKAHYLGVGITNKIVENGIDILENIIQQYTPHLTRFAKQPVGAHTLGISNHPEIHEYYVFDSFESSFNALEEIKKQLKGKLKYMELGKLK